MCPSDPAANAATVLGCNQELLRGKGETALTAELKWAAWRWLYETARCRAIGFEVKLEGPFGRIADVVGVGKGNAVYLVEVKASRGDLKRDDHSAADRAIVQAGYAQLRDAADLAAAILNDARAEALAQVPADADWRDAPVYRTARRGMDAAKEKLERRERSLQAFSTKFHDPRYLACADYHCIMAPRGLISLSEVPPYWGLLDAAGQTLLAPMQKQVRRNTAHVLRAIAVANTRDLRKLCLGSETQDADADADGDGDGAAEAGSVDGEESGSD